MSKLMIQRKVFNYTKISKKVGAIVIVRPPQKLKTHLVVFDVLWGYRRDVLEYANKLKKFDGKLGVLLDTLRDDYLFIITANHGNDSTHTGTDHTREKVPFIAYSTSQKKNRGTRRN